MICQEKSSILTWMPFCCGRNRDNPKLRGKPVIIGSDPRQTGGRGVVSTCSYEARAFWLSTQL